VILSSVCLFTFSVALPTLRNSLSDELRDPHVGFRYLRWAFKTHLLWTLHSVSALGVFYVILLYKLNLLTCCAPPVAPCCRTIMVHHFILARWHDH